MVDGSMSRTFFVEDSRDGDHDVTVTAFNPRTLPGDRR